MTVTATRAKLEELAKGTGFTADQLHEALTKLNAELESPELAKVLAETAETEAPNVDGVKVGDVFYSSWGYDQTNIDFAVVVGLTARCVKIQEVSKKVVRDLGPQVYVAPDLKAGPATVYDHGTQQTVPAPIKTKRVRRYKLTNGTFSDPSLARNSYSSWYAWNGTPLYETGLGWGH